MVMLLLLVLLLLSLWQQQQMMRRRLAIVLLASGMLGACRVLQRSVHILIGEPFGFGSRLRQRDGGGGRLTR